MALTADIEKAFLPGSFPLRRWKTNDQVLQKKLSPDLKEQQTVEFSDPQSKVLGLVWNTEDDSFKFDMHSLAEIQDGLNGYTKR